MAASAKPRIVLPDAEALAYQADSPYACAGCLQRAMAISGLLSRAEPAEYAAAVLAQLLLRQEETTGPCTMPGCTRQAWKCGLCKTHYEWVTQWVRRVEWPEANVARQCRVEGCPRRRVAHGLCFRHYQAARRHHIELGGQACDCRQA